MNPVNVSGRAARLIEVAAEQQLECLIVSDRSNIRWLTGFTGSAGTLVVSGDHLMFVTDGRYTNQAEQQMSAAGVEQFEIVTRRSVAEQRAEISARIAGCRTGVESSVIAHDEWSVYASAANVVSSDSLVRQMRRHKDSWELDRIRRAANIASDTLEELSDMLIPGVSERDIRDELEYRMRRAGADGPSYETIVATGSVNAASPHARPTTRTLEDGDLVVIDVGALIDGYHSDMTRSFVVGEPSAEQERWFDLVLASQSAGLERIEPGVSATAVDAACRTVFEEAGCSDLFTHGTGHGVGLDIHEEPFIGSTSASILAEGDVVTVEPGLYRVGTGGIRIEDLVVVTATGFENLTSLSKDSPCPQLLRTI